MRRSGINTFYCEILTAAVQIQFPKVCHDHIKLPKLQDQYTGNSLDCTTQAHTFASSVTSVKIILCVGGALSRISCVTMTSARDSARPAELLALTPYLPVSPGSAEIYHIHLIFTILLACFFYSSYCRPILSLKDLHFLSVPWVVCH